jgi:hypothetical protein
MDIMKAITRPEMTENEEVDIARAKLLHIAMQHPETGEIHLGEPGDIHVNISDRAGVELTNELDKEGFGWAIMGKKGNPIKFLNRKQAGYGRA